MSAELTISSSSGAEANPSAKEMIIVIHQKKVSIDDDTYSDSENLKEFIKGHYKYGIAVTLQDNYADYSTYQNVKDALDALNIVYTEQIIN